MRPVTVVRPGAMPSIRMLRFCFASMFVSVMWMVPALSFDADTEIAVSFSLPS